MLTASPVAGLAVGLDFDAIRVTASADTTLHANLQAGSDAGSWVQWDVGSGNPEGDDYNPQGLLQFDLSDFPHDLTTATVTLHPVAWSGETSTHAAETFADPGWNEQSTWETQPDFSQSSSLLTTAGASTWTISPGDTTPVELDVSAQVRRALRQGDLNFDGMRGADGVAADVAALELAIRDPVGFRAVFATETHNSTDLLDSPDLLDRADLDRSGQADAGDGAPFLAAHGYLPGDLNFSGQVNGADFLHWQRHVGQQASYTEGDVDFSGTVDGQDLALLLGHFGAPAPLPALKKL